MKWHKEIGEAVQDGYSAENKCKFMALLVSAITVLIAAHMCKLSGAE